MGKKTRMRECPAAGRAIDAAECGAGRHTTYACPEQCPHNPFSAANYEKFSSFERGADAKFMRWLVGYASDRPQVESRLREALASGPSVEFFRLLAWEGVYRKDADGDTALGKWEKAGFLGLSGDERVLMRGRMRMHFAICEAHRVLDAERVEVVDLLDPGRRPFLIVDRAFAAMSVRFGVYVTDIVPLPNYARLFGTCISVPGHHPHSPEKVIDEVLRHLGAPPDEVGRRGWLVEHFDRFHEALRAVGLARRRAMFEELDAQYGKAVYSLTRPLAECRQRLDAFPQTADDPIGEDERKEGFTQARIMFAQANDPEFGYVGEGATLGRILIGPTHWRLEAMGAARLDKLRERFEAWMGDRVRFAGERRDDIGARMKAKEPPFDPALVPPALLENPNRLVMTFSRVPATGAAATPGRVTADFLREQDRKFLDEAIPALDGKTPRQAATDPALRPRLIDLMKDRVQSQDQRNLETGDAVDLNWMLRELGLEEILFDPPPPRAPRGRDQDSADAAPQRRFWTLSPPPPLPPRPWTAAEAKERFEQALESFPTMTKALDYLTGIGYPLFADLSEMTQGLLEPRDFQFLAPILSQIVLCFAPRGTRPPEVSPAALRKVINEEMDVLDAQSMGTGHLVADKVMAWLTSGAQPELQKIALNVLTCVAEKAPASIRPSENSRIVQLLVLRAVVDELDRAMRRG